MRIIYGSSDVFSSDLPYLEGRGPAVLAVMDGIAAETGATLSQIALAWVAAQPGITAPIASATTVEQLDELMGSVDLTLSRTEESRVGKEGVRTCRSQWSPVN